MTKIEFKIKKVKEILDIIADHDQIIFRGGTALSLAYGEIKRSSEDIDFSVLKGPHKLDALMVIVKEQVDALPWTKEVKEEKFGNGMAITITFDNNGDEDIFNGGGFSESVIYLELPSIERKENEVPFVSMKPYPESLKTMKVMAIEAILKDKGMAITERFLSSKNLEWAVSARADARHIYDFFVLYDNHIKDVSDEMLINEIENSILMKEHKGYRRKYSTLTTPLNIDVEWSLFNDSYKALADNIKSKIISIVYPNAKAYSKAEFLKKYKIFFFRVLQLINNNLSTKSE